MIPSTGTVSNFSKIGSSNIFSVSFDGFQSYDLNDYQITFQTLYSITQWPFGFSGSNKNFTFDASFLLSQNSSLGDQSMLSIFPLNNYGTQFSVYIPLNYPENGGMYY